VNEPTGYAARRAAILARVSAAITARSPDRDALITLDEALTALGPDGVMSAERADVPVTAIVGTVAGGDAFDREFRPLTPRVRDRWRSVVHASETGVPLPPVELTRLGDMYFVRDGHHRVAVARALGRRSIEANVVRLCTIAFAMMCLRAIHLPSKAAERLFLERVPLPADVRRDLWLDRPADWLLLADSAEAWGFRNGWSGQTALDRQRFAEAWWANEVQPAIAASNDLRRERDVETYLAVLNHRRASG
jgi:hypothetical protein